MLHKPSMSKGPDREHGQVSMIRPYVARIGCWWECQQLHSAARPNQTTYPISLLCTTSQAELTDVLPLVFERARLADARTACRVMQLSKAYKAAMTCCEPCIHVRLLVDGSESLEKVAGFASWMQRHGRLVKQLALGTPNEPEPGACRAAESMLSFALSLAASNGSTFRFHQVVIESDILSPALVSSLAAHSITSLHLPVISVAKLRVPALSSSLQQLTGLQKLALRAWADPDDGENEVEGRAIEQLPMGLLSSLQTLTRLTRVELAASGPCTWQTLQYLPSSVQQLQVSVDSVSCMLDIPQLTSLQELDVIAAGFAEGSALPPSVPVMRIRESQLPEDPCRLLAGVQQLHIRGLDESAERLAQLSALQSLTSMSMSCYSLTSAAAAAPAWGRLCQLQSLTVYCDGEVSDQQYSAVLQAIATAKGLTSLEFRFSACCPVPCAVHIAQLPNLLNLKLLHAGSSRQDMLQLRKLTQLTALELRWCSIDDGTAAAVLGRLTNLRTLLLRQATGKVMSDAVLPAIEQLKSLRSLSLGLPGFTDGTLELLEGLTQLTRLGLPGIVPDRCGLARRLRCRVSYPWS